jgi:hypothetical protein
VFSQVKNEKAPDFIGGRRPVNNSLIRVNMLSSQLRAALPKNIGRGGSFAPANWAAKASGWNQALVLIISYLFAAGYIEC